MKKESRDIGYLYPLTDWCKHKALIFDNTGFCVGEKKINFKDSTFTFKDRIYNFIPEKSSFFKRRYWFSSTKYYFYNLDNPMPLSLLGGDNNKSIIDPIAYKRILETDLIKKLNDLAKPNFLAWLFQPKVLIILLVLIAIVWYFASGHTIQGLSESIKSTGQGLSK